MEQFYQNWKFKFKKIEKKLKDKYITIIITATKVKAIHIPYPTPAPPHPHIETYPPPLYLTSQLWLMSAPRSNSTSTMERCPSLEALIRAVYPNYTT